MNSDELVLCSATAALPASWLPEAAALPISEASLLTSLQNVPPVWLPRSQAEVDVRFQQWIPYALVRSPAGELAAYRRRGNEARLHGQWSLGIGGHINQEDQPSGVGFPSAWSVILRNGLQREVAEEFPSAMVGEVRFLGLIHERHSAVGRVHVGAVFLIELQNRPDAPGPELVDFVWQKRETSHPPKVEARNFELWSRLALELL